jgi:hypothetical protein
MLLLSLITAIKVTPSEASPQVTFECGVYSVRGWLQQNERGAFLLVIGKGTSSPFELELLGGDFDSKLRNLGSEIEAEIYVPNPIKNPNRPFVFLQRVFSSVKRPLNNPIQLVSKSKCKDALKQPHF